jgi:hypothetical protein
MVSRIRDELNRGTGYDAAIKREIVSSIDFYKSRRFHFNIRRATTDTIAGQEYYDMPTDFIEVDLIRLLYSSGNFTDPLIETTYAWIERNRTNQNYRSEPEKYAMQGNDLRLWPVPDDAYRLTMTYLYEDSGVSASASDGASNDWMTHGEEMIRLRTKAGVLRNQVGGPEAFATADTFDREALRVYRELKRRANRQQSSGRLVPWL